MGRRVIDIDDDRIVAGAGGFAEPVWCSGEGEEIALKQAATRVAGYRLAQRQLALLVPFDDLGDQFDDGQRGDPRIVENRLGGIAETETADHDIEALTLDHRDREIGERHLAPRPADTRIGKERDRE